MKYQLGLIFLCLLLTACKPPTGDVVEKKGSQEKQEEISKQRIPNIDNLTAEQLREYKTECHRYKNIHDARVQWASEDCSKVDSKWLNVDYGKKSTAKPAQYLPKLH